MRRILFFAILISTFSCSELNKPSYVRLNLKNLHSELKCIDMNIRLGRENLISTSVCRSNISTDGEIKDLLVPQGEISVTVEIKGKGIMLDTLFHTDTVRSVYISYIGCVQEITERKLDFEGETYILKDTLTEIPEQLTFVTFNRIPIRK